MAKIVNKRGRPKTKNPKSAAERMRAYRKRKRDAGLKNVRRWIPDTNSNGSTFSDHRLLDARSLAMHCLIAKKITENPILIEKAKNNLVRWSERYEDQVPLYIREWTAYLDRPWQEVADFITSMTEDATRLRSSSPFAGILADDERERIYAAFRS